MSRLLRTLAFCYHFGITFESKLLVSSAFLPPRVLRMLWLLWPNDDATLGSTSDAEVRKPDSVSGVSPIHRWQKLQSSDAPRFCQQHLSCHKWVQGICQYPRSCWNQHTFDEAMRFAVRLSNSEEIALPSLTMPPKMAQSDRLPVTSFPLHRQGPGRFSVLLVFVWRWCRQLLRVGAWTRFFSGPAMETPPMHHRRHISVVPVPCFCQTDREAGAPVTRPTGTTIDYDESTFAGGTVDGSYIEHTSHHRSRRQHAGYHYGSSPGTSTKDFDPWNESEDGIRRAPDARTQVGDWSAEWINDNIPESARPATRRLRETNNV